MSILYKITFFFFITLSIFGQNSTTYSIGSSENTVLNIQGQPTSISRIGNIATFFYGSSYVSFTNNKLDGYHNNGNLKIRINTSTPSKPKVRKSDKSNTEKFNNEVRWVYFTFITDTPSFSTNPYTNKLEIKNDYSKLFSISGYTNEMLKNLEFCIQKEYKEFTGKSVIVESHVYLDRDSAMIFWNLEKGYMKSFSCWYLQQYGVMQH